MTKFLGENWVLHATDDDVEHAASALLRLKERGEWPETPKDRTPADIAVEVDAMRHMTKEQKETVPYAAHGNLYLHKLQLLAREIERGEQGALDDR